MIRLLTPIKWQLKLLHKNNIITVSLAVTFIYGLILFLLRDTKYIDELLVALILNDPTVIGYFFVALFIYTEIRQGVLNALFVTPVSVHSYLISKTISLSIIGTLCSLGLVVAVKGFHFDIINFSIGAFNICLLSSFLGIIMVTFASEFLKFALLSIPVFFIFSSISLLSYLHVIDIGFIKYLLPIQGSLDLIDNAISGKSINYLYIYVSFIVVVAVLYSIGYRLFTKKFVTQ